MEKISFKNIRTHNLKNLDIDIPANKVTVIYGRSGAGKTSLAFSSIYQYCKDEFEALESGHISDNDYIIGRTEGIIPAAVAVPQRNANNNPKSTLYSYLNIPRFLSLLASKKFSVPEYSSLKLNNFKNGCPHCHGHGTISEINTEALIHKNIPLNQKPFACWNTGATSDYYNQLLLAFCLDQGIDTTKTFVSLSEKEKNLILKGESDKKIIFRCRQNGKMKQRRAFYKGVMLFSNTEIQTRKSDTIYKQENTCPFCKGSRINEKVAALKIFNLDFQNFLLLPLSELCKFFESTLKESFLFKIFSSISEMGLGYLNLARSVPSLSGGELQKIIFSRLLVSQTTGILIVLDEISSQVNPVDYPNILSKIQNLSKKNTLLLVEHSQYFIDHADQAIHIGQYAGAAGGKICKKEIITALPNNSPRNKIKDYFDFKDLSKNNIQNQNVKIPKGCVTIFTGVSGAGKSSLAKAISETEKSTYISQKLPVYSGRSSVASITGLNKLIAEYFSKKLKKEIGFFIPTKEGGCQTCEGKGVIKYERSFEKDIYLICNECDGLLFDDNLETTNLSLNGLNIRDVYNTELKNLCDFFQDPKIQMILKTLDTLGISHLKLNRKTQSLSGGEMRRIKLCELLSRRKKSNKILIIDEPVAGLDPETASKVLDFIYRQSNMFNATIIIEHRTEAENYADYKVCIGPLPGDKGGRILSQKKLGK